MNNKFNNAASVISIAAVLIAVSAFYKLAHWSSRGGEETPLYSTPRRDPYGAAALKTLLEERGIQVRILEKPRLEPEDRGVLIQVLPLVEKNYSLWGNASDNFVLKTDELKNWISKGNTVIQFTWQVTDLMYDVCPECINVEDSVISDFYIGIQKDQASGKFPENIRGSICEAEWISIPALVHPEKEISRLVLQQPMKFIKKNDDEKFRSLAACKEEIAVWEYHVGDGKFIAVGSPTPALNYYLPTGGNLDFILSVVGSGPVIIDEWSHGIGHEDTIMGLIHRAGLTPVIFQALLILFLYAWSVRGHRRVDRDEIERRRSSLEQIETLGYLYSQALSEEETFKRVKSEVLRRMSGAMKCALSELSKKISALSPQNAGTARKILKTLDAAENKSKRINVTRSRHSELAEVLALTYQLEKEINRERKNA